MALTLFESLNIKPLSAVSIAALTASQQPNYASPNVHLEDGSLVFNTDTGHLMQWSVSGGQFVVVTNTDGYTLLESGFWMKKVDLSGPYVFDGTAMHLAAHS